MKPRKKLKITSNNNGGKKISKWIKQINQATYKKHTPTIPYPSLLLILWPCDFYLLMKFPKKKNQNFHGLCLLMLANLCSFFRLTPCFVHFSFWYLFVLAAFFANLVWCCYEFLWYHNFQILAPWILMLNALMLLWFLLGRFDGLC